MSLDETRRRELLRERIAARRAGQPRRLKTLGPTAIRMVELAVRLRSTAAPPSAAPSEAVIRLAARGKSPSTWNRYAAALLRWEAYAGRVGSTFLPADPTHFANFLAEAATGASGHTQTKQRACAIDALSTVARVPSPVGDALVQDVRSGLRRTLRGTRGRARPIFSYELPTADTLPSPPSGKGGGPRRMVPGEAVAPPSVRKRARAQALRCSAVLEGAALRYDDIVEGQIGDAIVLPGLVDLSIFGSKTDSTLSGQPSVLPDPENPRSGAHAFLEGIRLGLIRLAALPPLTLAALATRFRAALSAREIGQGASELASWPADIRALSAPLYAAGLPVHCLPIYGQWQHARLHAQSDLQAGVERHIFLALTSHALASAGVEVAGMGAHSFRRGRAVELFHGHASRETVTEVLRHRSAASTRPYLSDSVRLAALAVTMSAVASGRVDLADPGIRRPLGPGAAGGARFPLQAPLLGPTGPGEIPAGVVRSGVGLAAAAAHLRQPLAGGRGIPPPVGNLATSARPLARRGAAVGAGAGRIRAVPAADGRPDPQPTLRGLPGPAAFSGGRPGHPFGARLGPPPARR